MGKEQEIIKKRFPHRSLDLDTIDLDDEEELAKQQIVARGSKRLVLSGKAAEVFEIVERYGLPKENMIETLMEVLGVSKDSAQALFLRYREGCL